MNPIDVMIGDWVQISDIKDKLNYGKVDAIYWDLRNERIISVQGKNFRIHFEPERIAGIPLTAEILNRNGFERISKSPYKTEYRLCFDEDNSDFLFVDIHHLRDYVTVYYNPINRMVHLDCNIDNCMVHELQHALRLAKINKEIEL